MSGHEYSPARNDRDTSGLDIDTTDFDDSELPYESFLVSRGQSFTQKKEDLEFETPSMSNFLSELHATAKTETLELHKHNSNDIYLVETIREVPEDSSQDLNNKISKNSLESTTNQPRSNPTAHTSRSKSAFKEDLETQCLTSPKKSYFISSEQSLPVEKNQTSAQICSDKRPIVFTIVGDSLEVQICKHYHVGYGEGIYVSGNIPELGNWDLDQSLKLIWNEGDLWTASFSMAKGSFATGSINYRFGIMNYDNPNAIEFVVGGIGETDLSKVISGD